MSACTSRCLPTHPRPRRVSVNVSGVSCLQGATALELLTLTAVLTPLTKEKGLRRTHTVKLGEGKLMMRKLLVVAGLLVACAGMLVTSPATAATATRLVSGLAGRSGSTVGPDGAIYVTERAAGRVSRVDPQTGAVTTFASGLPPAIPAVGLGGAMDVEFKGGTAYVLVTLVGPDVGGSDVVGICRMDDPSHFTVIADIGAWSIDNPPATAFDVPTGVQYAMEKYRNGFLVTDGHHNRVLRVTLDGTITQVIAFDNIVPTGLQLRDETVYMAEAGPTPHRPENGKIVSFQPGSNSVTEVASGGRLLVDVEFGPGEDLFALAQGKFTPGNPAGSPAIPNTGKLLRVDGQGGFAVVEKGLNQPTSLEFKGKRPTSSPSAERSGRSTTSRADRTARLTCG